MEILRGSPALSAFRINKLLSRCQDAHLPVSDIYAEYVHFADVSAPLNSDVGRHIQPGSYRYDRSVTHVLRELLRNL